MQNFGNIIYKVDTKAYVIKDGTYTVPYPGDTSVPAQIHEEFDALYAEIGEYAKLNPDKVTEEQPHVLTFDELKAIKLSEINYEYNKATSSLISSYPTVEILTFNKQEAAARAYKEDPFTSSEFLSDLAKARGITLDDLVTRIINKSDIFSSSVATLTGQRQRYEDLIDAATTVEEIESIKPVYTLNK